MKIITTHRLTTTCRCPVDDSTDVYVVTVDSEALIPVEDILAATRQLAGQAMFQENYTRALAQQIPSLCTVTVEGTHSGVTTSCVALGLPE